MVKLVENLENVHPPVIITVGAPDDEGDVCIKANDTDLLWVMNDGTIMRAFTGGSLAKLGFQTDRGTVKIRD